MQLTILSHDDKTYFMEIGQEMQLGDLLALVAAEVREDVAVSHAIHRNH